MSKFFNEVDKGLYTSFASNIDNMTIARYIVNDWRNSQTIHDMREANRYFAVENTGIRTKTRSYVDTEGTAHDNPTLSNERIPSAFLRKITQQKVNYAFGKPFIISIQNLELFNGTADEAAAKEYLRLWKEFLGIKFQKVLKTLATNAIKNGVGWVYIYIYDDGSLQLSVIDSETIYPQWSDKAHTELDCLVRDYEVLAYDNGSRSIINMVEFWDKEIVETYVSNTGYLQPYYTDKQLMESAIPEDINPKIPIKVYPISKIKDGIETQEGWGKVPFLALKGEVDELPLLNIIKKHIDAYDRLNSKSIDSLLDDVDPVIVMKNLTAELREIHAARSALKNSRMVVVDEEGGAEYLQVKADIEAVQKKLEHLRKDIREFSNSVDVQDVKFGNNPSGVALKSMYQDLDVYVNGLELEFQLFMENLKYFFDTWLELTGRGTFEQGSKFTLSVKLDRDMMINTAELVDQTVKLAPLVSRQTLDEYNPAVANHEIEDKRRLIQLKDELANNELYNFGNDLRSEGNNGNSEEQRTNSSGT